MLSFFLFSKIKHMIWAGKSNSNFNLSIWHMWWPNFWRPIIAWTKIWISPTRGGKFVHFYGSFALKLNLTQYIKNFKIMLKKSVYTLSFLFFSFLIVSSLILSLYFSCGSPSFKKSCSICPMVRL